MRRIYQDVVLNHFKRFEQMLFLTGPRQVGKTTIAKNCQAEFEESLYLNYDIIKDRDKILSGQNFIENIFPLEVLRKQKPLVIFDEIHKFKNWKNYLKGFYDLYSKKFHILVTGSARLDLYRSSGDSLMGRYFQFRVHPISVAETVRTKINSNFFQIPKKPDSQKFENLYQFGGFPNPFLQNDLSFFNRWQNLRYKQLFFEDIQTITQIQDIKQIELLAKLILSQSGQILNKSNLGKKIQVTSQTITRWCKTLEQFYYAFFIQPWHKNVTRSLIKEPKCYLWDWSLVKDPGAKFENFIASHLLKSIHFWQDSGLGNFDLFYLRDKDKKEVDFLVTKDEQPWILIEVKTNKNENLSKNIFHFQKQVKAEHVLQVNLEADFVNKTCLQNQDPVIAPAKTFLSQLV